MKPFAAVYYSIWIVFYLLFSPVYAMGECNSGKLKTYPVPITTDLQNPVLTSMYLELKEVTYNQHLDKLALSADTDTDTDTTFIKYLNALKDKKWQQAVSYVTTSQSKSDYLVHLKQSGRHWNHFQGVEIIAKVCQSDSVVYI